MVSVGNFQPIFLKPRFDHGKQKMKMIASSLQREDIINKVIPTINNKAKLKIQDFEA